MEEPNKAHQGKSSGFSFIYDWFKQGFENPAEEKYRLN